MIGDFDGSATEFWKLFRDEAKSHDDAQIYARRRTWRVHLFSCVHILFIPITGLSQAGLFSAALTGFVIDLQVKLTDETVSFMSFDRIYIC
jgi:hypothetical protein